ncbi:MAG: alternative ribosome rescue aminoacyl-tRNA hydrolase ArfB [Planctomycetota bacterium]
MGGSVPLRVSDGGSSNASNLERLAPAVRAQPGAVRFEFVKSSGPGGQNVNKRSTKAVLRVALADLVARPSVLKRIEQQAGPWLTESGEILIEADEHRSQKRNKEACEERLRALLVKASAEPKRRIATKPSRGSVRRRIEAKKHRGEIKQRRKPPRAGE